MYVCMYVRMYLCMYLLMCAYACMFLYDCVECLDPPAAKLALVLRTLDPSQQGKLDLKEPGGGFGV